MTIEKFSCAMHHKVYSIFERLLKVWRGECIVAGYFFPIFFCKPSESFNVHALQCRIGGRFKIYQANVLLGFEYFLCLIQIAQVNNDRFNSEIRQNNVAE